MTVNPAVIVFYDLDSVLNSKNIIEITTVEASDTKRHQFASSALYGLTTIAWPNIVVFIAKK